MSSPFWPSQSASGLVGLRSIFGYGFAADGYGISNCSESHVLNPIRRIRLSSDCVGPNVACSRNLIRSPDHLYPTSSAVGPSLKPAALFAVAVAKGVGTAPGSSLMVPPLPPNASRTRLLDKPRQARRTRTSPGVGGSAQ